MYRTKQRESFSRLDKLADFLELDTEKRDKLLSRSKFVLNLPKRLAEKIKKNTLDDPLLRQFVPLMEESVRSPLFQEDPVQDKSFQVKRKLLHKYKGRALLVATGACAMHCRYCFRQNFDYDKEDKTFHEEIEALKADSSIEEIILSGGDPLSLNDEVLGGLIARLEKVPHLKRLRFHTRFPIGIPERITPAFLALLAGTRFQVWFVVHCNHPAELDGDVLAALKSVQKCGVPVLNQAVLLKGVNDDADTLKTLCGILVNAGILPYYLHQLDPVQGAMHFEVAEDLGRSIIVSLTQTLSGYAVPKYVREIPGEMHKTSLMWRAET